MLVPMAKVEIIGPKNRFFDVVSLVHELGTLHIEDLTKKIQAGEIPLDTMEVFDRQKREEERMEDQLIRVRAILRALHREETPVDPAVRKTAIDAVQKYIFDQYYVIMMYARANVYGYTDRFVPAPFGFASNMNWNAELWDVK